jgi:hypothetical protein
LLPQAGKASIMSALQRRAAIRVAPPRPARARRLRLSMLLVWIAGAVLPWAALLFVFYLLCN